MGGFGQWSIRNFRVGEQLCQSLLTCLSQSLRLLKATILPARVPISAHPRSVAMRIPRRLQPANPGLPATYGPPCLARPSHQIWLARNRRESMVTWCIGNLDVGAKSIHVREQPRSSEETQYRAARERDSHAIDIGTQGHATLDEGQAPAVYLCLEFRTSSGLGWPGRQRQPCGMVLFTSPWYTPFARP